jgi:hypothetical protein
MGCRRRADLSGWPGAAVFKELWDACIADLEKESAEYVSAVSQKLR